MPQATAIEDIAQHLAGINTLLVQAKRDSALITQQWQVTERIFSALSRATAGWLGSQTRIGTGLEDIRSQISKIAQEPFFRALDDQQRSLEALRMEFRALAEERRHADSVEKANAAAALGDQISALETLIDAESQRNKAIALYKTFHDRLTWQLTGYLVLLNKAANLWFSINRALAEVHARDRGKLFAETTMAAAQVGASFDETATVLNALVERGRDLTGNLQADVKLALQLGQTYGLSAAASAEMTAAFGRLNLDVRRVADGLARVVAQTALSADEAFRLSANLARAFSFMRPGQVGGLGEVSEFLMGVEGRMKSLSGTAGELTDFYKRAATTLEGMTVAEGLGIDTASLAKNRQAARQSLEGLAQFVERATAGMDVKSRAMALAMLSDQLGLSVQTLGNLRQALQATNAQSEMSLTVEAQWRKQLETTGKSWDNLTKSFSLLLSQVLVPVMQLATPVIDALAKVTQMIFGSPVLVKTLQVIGFVMLPTMVVGLVKAAWTMGALARQAWLLAKNAALASVAVRAAAQAEATRAGASGVGAAGDLADAIRRRPVTLKRQLYRARGLMTTWGQTPVTELLSKLGVYTRNLFMGFRSFIPVIWGGLKPVLAAAFSPLALSVGALALVIHKQVQLYRKTEEDKLKAQLFTYSQQDRFKQAVERRVMAMAKEGDVAALRQFLGPGGEMRTRAAQAQLTPDEINTLAGQQIGTIKRAMTQMYVRDLLESHGVAKTSAELEHYYRLEKVMEEVRDAFMEGTKEQRAIRNLEFDKAKREEQERAETRANALMGLLDAAIAR